jgi:hypothetical protein
LSDNPAVARDARDPLSDPLERGAANTPGVWFPHTAYVDGKIWRRFGRLGVWTMGAVAAGLFLLLLVWLFA